MRMHGRLGAGTRGFTLMELLIALVILSVIMLLMFSGLRLGSRAWEGVETLADRASEVRIARNLIERSLRQVREITLRLEGRRYLVFAGEADRLEFVAPLSAHVGIPGLYILRLTLEEAEGDTQRLMLTRWLLHPEVLNGEGDAPAWEPLAEATGLNWSEDGMDRDLAAGAQGRTLLLPEVAAFRLSYYGVVQGEQVAQWYEDWLDQRALPYRVRLELNSPRAEWPAAIITLPGPGVLAEAP